MSFQESIRLSFVGSGEFSGASGIGGCVDWDSADSVALLNDRMPQELKNALATFSSEVSGMSFPEGVERNEPFVFIATSGSTSLAPGELKLAALKKSSILCSAKSVNQWVQVSAKDTWLNPLPLFHIGGLAIEARAFLSGSRVVPYLVKWQPSLFVDSLKEHNASLTSLVPTQVFDLVQMRLKSPASLRAVFVGGAALSEQLYAEARSLGWPILPTFGFTEAASQVATASLDSLDGAEFPKVQVLPHLQIKTLEDRLCVRGESLFAGYFYFKNNSWCFADPKIDGWFKSEDRVSIDGSFLTFLGREADFVKINGEGVDLHRLRQKLPSSQVELVAIPDERAGVRLIFVGESSESQLQKWAEEFNAGVFPYERVREVVCVDEIPRSPMGKILRGKLLEKLQNMLLSFEK